MTKLTDADQHQFDDTGWRVYRDATIASNHFTIWQNRKRELWVRDGTREAGPLKTVDQAHCVAKAFGDHDGQTI